MDQASKDVIYTLSNLTRCGRVSPGKEGDVGPAKERRTGQAEGGSGHGNDDEEAAIAGGDHGDQGNEGKRQRNGGRDGELGAERGKLEDGERRGNTK